MMQAFGILPQTPTVAIQNNQTNNQSGEVHKIEYTKEAEAKAIKLLASALNDNK